MEEIQFRIWADGKMDYSPETFTGWLNDNFVFDGYDVGKEPIVMQYTGFRDSKGKKIYHKDIICIVKDIVVDVIGGYERTEPEGKFFEVIWECGAWFIGNEMLWEWAKQSEIIGNVLENLELSPLSTEL